MAGVYSSLWTLAMMLKLSTSSFRSYICGYNDNGTFTSLLEFCVLKREISLYYN
jgi:hypothetical protein